MRKSERVVVGYALWLTVVVCAVMWLARSQAARVHLSTSEVCLAVAFVALTAVAGRFPLRVSSKTVFVVDTGLIFGAILIFPMPVGPLVAGLGVFLGLVAENTPLLDMTINLCAAVLQCMAAQGVYLLLGGTIPTRFDTITIALPIIGAAATMIALQGLLISAAVSVYQHSNLGRALLRAWHRAFKEDVALILWGVLTVASVRAQPWALPITALPVVLVYLLVRSSLRAEAAARKAVEALADLIEKRDPFAAGHSTRVARMAGRLAAELGVRSEECARIRDAARLHDLGKVVIDSVIWTKPGQLDARELGAVSNHPVTGAELIARFPDLTRAAEYVRHHHERWDGRGYPSGLRGEQIPLGACIIAVADAYDAMTSDRAYRRALTSDGVLSELQRGAGVQWDEQVVSALLRIVERDRARDSARRVPAHA